MPQILPVLLGGDANVYGMARSFYETCGVRSLAVGQRALPALAHSRLVHMAARDAAFAQDSVFHRHPAGAGRAAPGKTRVLVSCADGYTALLARHADELRGAYRFACPPPAALARLADKQRFAAACRAAGLRTPRTVTLCPGGCLPPLPADWPIIVKAGGFHRVAGVPLPRQAQGLAGAGRRRPAADSGRRGGVYRHCLRRSTSPADTRLGVVNAYCAQDGSVPWLVQGQPLCRSARPREWATMPPCWWSPPGRTPRC